MHATQRVNLDDLKRSCCSVDGKAVPGQFSAKITLQMKNKTANMESNHNSKGVREMPTIDKPLAELQAYTGRNPRPADFDDYWDRALNEMRQTEPQIELVPSSFQTPAAECFDLY